MNLSIYLTCLRNKRMPIAQETVILWYSPKVIPLVYAWVAEFYILTKLVFYDTTVTAVAKCQYASIFCMHRSSGTAFVHNSWWNDELPTLFAKIWPYCVWPCKARCEHVTFFFNQQLTCAYIFFKGLGVFTEIVIKLTFHAHGSYFKNSGLALWSVWD